jgi:hypothetical protein
MNKQPSLLLLLVLLYIIPVAQNKYADYNFQAVDSFIQTVKYEHDVIKLSQDLTKNYREDIYKVRAIFKWITENISYDYKFINKGKEIKTPDCEGSVNCNQAREEWKEKYIKNVVKNKKGICSGYAELFKKLCELSNIKAEVVAGYAKNKPYQVGNPLSVNHAWNAVMIDSVWYYLDATWAAGGCTEDENTGKLLQYRKEYNDYYWLTPYSRLVRNHYPENGKWVAQPAFVKQVFFNKPYYYSAAVLENMYNEMPDTGMLVLKKGDTIHFSFRYTTDITRLQINSNNFRNPPLWYKDEKSKKIKRDTLAEKNKSIFHLNAPEIFTHLTMSSMKARCIISSCCLIIKKQSGTELRFSTKLNVLPASFAPSQFPHL